MDVGPVGAPPLSETPRQVADRYVDAVCDLDPIVAIQAFYVMAAQLSKARGLDPDRPRHLSKVTKTN